jgi:hypothetical protein
MLRAFSISSPVWKNLSIPAGIGRESLLGMVCEQCQSLSDSRPRVYLLLATAFALAGYAWLLLFPWLVFASALGIYHAVFAGEGIAWALLLIWLVVGVLAALVSYRLFHFRPAMPAGRELDNLSCTALFKLVADQSRHYCSIRIDRIVLSGDFDLYIRKTPCFVLPVWSTNTLVIGLPLIQSLSDTQFQCALARRLGQFSKRYNRLENWLYQLREIWPLYCKEARMQGPGYQPVAWFFCAYAHLYRMITVPVARNDELDADTYAMELFSDEQVLDMITTQMVCQQYLAERYWPVVRKLAASNARVLDKLHTGMAAVLRAGLTAGTVNEWLAKALAAEDYCADEIPPLASRIDNIGFGVARMDALTTEPAAAVYRVKQ